MAAPERAFYTEVWSSVLLICRKRRHCSLKIKSYSSGTMNDLSPNQARTRDLCLYSNNFTKRWHHYDETTYRSGTSGTDASAVALHLTM